MSVLFDKIMLQEIRVLMIAFEKGIFYVVALADDYNFVVVGGQDFNREGSSS